MEWLSSIRTAIDYMEEHLTDDISAQDVADRVPFRTEARCCYEVVTLVPAG